MDLYKWIAKHRSELSIKHPIKAILWALVGNDDDGVYGEGPKSGSSWLSMWDSDDRSMKRFWGWQLRNPLHNFTFYVIGIAWKKHVEQTSIITLGEKNNIIEIGNKVTRGVWPQGLYGVSFVLRSYILPYLSFIIPMGGKRLEGYFGWRERGNFGLSFRLKTIKKGK